MLESALVRFRAFFQQVSRPFHGAESQLHHERGFPGAAYGSQGVHVCPAVQQQPSDGDGPPVMYRPGDPPPSGKFGMYEFGIFRQPGPDRFDTVRHHSIPAVTHPFGNQKVRDRPMGRLIAVAAVPADELPQQRMGRDPVVACELGTAIDKGACGFQIPPFEHRKEGFVRSGFHAYTTLRARRNSFPGPSILGVSIPGRQPAADPSHGQIGADQVRRDEPARRGQHHGVGDAAEEKQ